MSLYNIADFEGYFDQLQKYVNIWLNIDNRGDDEADEESYVGGRNYHLNSYCYDSVIAFTMRDEVEKTLATVFKEAESNRMRCSIQ